VLDATTATVLERHTEDTGGAVEICGFRPAEFILPTLLCDALIVKQARPVGVRCVAAERREGIINHHAVDRGDGQEERDHAEEHVPTADSASNGHRLFHG